jgi:hypothetical protein
MLRYRRLFFPVFLVLSLFLIAPAAHGFSDLEGHWAEKTIKDLVRLEILHGYPDKTFRPDQSITRAELAKILAVTLNLKSSSEQALPDIDDHWAKEYACALVEKKIITAEKGAFYPERPVTREEAVGMLTRLVNIKHPEEEYTLKVTPSFADITEESPAFAEIELASRLGILPGYYQQKFNPSYLATRADIAWMISRLREIKTLRGTVLDTNEASGLLTVKPETNGVKVDGEKDEQEARLVLVNDETVLLRNNITTKPGQVLAGDKLTVFFNPQEKPVFVKAYGEVTQNDLLSRLSAMVKERLTPEQIAAILAGDWDSVKDALTGELYNQMLNYGLTPAEAEAILMQDWAYLDMVSRDRLAEALSGYLGITRDLSRALLDRDLERIKEYAKIELITYALGRILEQSPSATPEANG